MLRAPPPYNSSRRLQEDEQCSKADYYKALLKFRRTQCFSDNEGGGARISSRIICPGINILQMIRITRRSTRAIPRTRVLGDLERGGSPKTAMRIAGGRDAGPTGSRCLPKDVAILDCTDVGDRERGLNERTRLSP